MASRKAAAEWQNKNKWPAHLFKGKNNVVGGSGIPSKDTPEWKKLFARNEALAEPRNDMRFKNINTMHPKKSSKFSGKH